MDISLSELLLGIAAVGPVVLGLLVKGWVKDSLPAYFAEKGKNLATKEDIAAITHKIEAVKNEHAADLREVSGLLSRQENLELDKARYRRSSVIDFYDAAARAVLIAQRLAMRGALHQTDAEAAADLREYDQADQRVEEAFLRAWSVLSPQDSLLGKVLELRGAWLECNSHVRAHVAGALRYRRRIDWVEKRAALGNSNDRERLLSERESALDDYEAEAFSEEVREALSKLLFARLPILLLGFGRSVAERELDSPPVGTANAVLERIAAARSGGMELARGPEELEGGSGSAST